MLFPMLLANLAVCLELNLALSNLILVFHREEHLFFQDLPIIVVEHEHHIEGREDFGFGLFEQAHGGPILEIVKCRKYRSRVCRYCSTYETACDLAFSSVLVWTVENAAKTVVWTRIDRCVFDDTENGYF